MLPILDFFLLALIAEGVDSPYRWQRRASISTGASLPSIRRLAAAGLVHEAEAGPRGRRRFALTRSGRAELKNVDRYLQTALLQKSLDMESLLRLVAMGYTIGSLEMATALLKQSAQDRRPRGLDSPERLSARLSRNLAEFYSEVIARYDVEKRAAATRTIDALVKSIESRRRRKAE